LHIPFLTVLNNFFVCLSSANGFAKGTRASFGICTLGLSSMSTSSFVGFASGTGTGELSFSSTITIARKLAFQIISRSVYGVIHTLLILFLFLRLLHAISFRALLLLLFALFLVALLCSLFCHCKNCFVGIGRVIGESLFCSRNFDGA